MSGDDLLFGLVRALHIGGAMLLVAFPVFALFHWKPALVDRERHDSFCRMTLLALSVVLLVEIVTGVMWLGLATATMSGETSWRNLSWGEMEAVLTQTQFGLLWVVRGALACMLGSLLAAVAGGRAVNRGAAVLAIWVSLALGGALLGSLAWAGHAASGVRWPAWHLTVDVVHLLSGAVWPAGLVPLALFLRQSRREARALNDEDVAVVRRFSQASFFAVLALVASGVANGWLMLPSWSALVGSFYGQLLLAKIAIVGGMVALGAMNRYRFVPALAAGGSPQLARMIAAESGLACAVLFIVGVMGITPPPS